MQVVTRLMHTQCEEWAKGDVLDLLCAVCLVLQTCLAPMRGFPYYTMQVIDNGKNSMEGRSREVVRLREEGTNRMKPVP